LVNKLNGDIQAIQEFRPLPSALPAKYNEAVAVLPGFVGLWRTFLDKLSQYLIGPFNPECRLSEDDVIRSLQEIESFRVPDEEFTTAVNALVDPATAVVSLTMPPEGEDRLEVLRELCPGLFPRETKRPSLPIDDFRASLAKLIAVLRQCYEQKAKYQRLMELTKEGNELAEEAAMLRRSADSDIHFARLRNEEKLARLNELYRAQRDAIVAHYKRLFESQENGSA
jgi:hypothetical protein